MLYSDKGPKPGKLKFYSLGEITSNSSSESKLTSTKLGSILFCKDIPCLSVGATGT